MMRARRAAALLPLFLFASAACQDELAPNRASSASDPSAPAPVDPDNPVDPFTPAPALPPGTALPDGGVVPPPAEPPYVYVPYDINHVLSTGQSNSVANDGKPILSTSQPYSNLMFDVGVMTASKCGGDGCTHYDEPAAFVPLVEGDSFFYPVETMSSGLANQTTKMGLALGVEHTMLVSLHGRSGNSYLCLRKGSCDWWPTKGYVQPFDDGMRQVRDAKRLAEAAGKSYVVRAVTVIHGENDHYAYSAGKPAFPMPGTDGVSTLDDYADALLEWQRDYETGVQEITGQTVPVPLFLNQYSHWNDVPTSVIPYMQMDAHLRSSGKVTIVGPTYVLPYSNDCLHFTGPGERWLGEYFAKAYSATVLEGRRWEPLRPIAVTRAGAIVTAKFHVPAPPLVFDTTRVDDPGDFGFEWYDESGATPAIAKVEIIATDTVQVTLASAPTTGGRLRYAYTFEGCAGSRTLARGNLRDSDATPSQNGHELFNWAVHFDAPVP
ncbi:MAG: hypothetical protein KIT84_37790 [Labilithrix sp.]|nr:hypothetical protein [Labilithrix sp.]MCW5816810.1 hypothetical protein [Labilithrix sp.]